MKRIPFDYEAVQNGATVVTRNGTEVVEIGLFPSLNQPVICSINGQAETYSLSGMYDPTGRTPTEMDLFLLVEESPACDCDMCKIVRQAKLDRDALDGYINANPKNSLTLISAHASLCQLIDFLEDK